jgi:thiamine pyrophosphate-dependent acetolactate synthase large subunit-like protein
MTEAATRTVSGAHALVGALERCGIRHLFGVPGHGAYPIYDALNDFPAVRPVVGRNEQGALFAADGFSRVTQDVAVATSVPQAGVTNSLTSLWEANGHGSRLLYVIEHDPIHAQLLRPIAAYYEQAFSVSDIAPAVHGLIRRLRCQRPGLAVLEVPNGVLHSTAEVDLGDGTSDRAFGADRAAIQEAARVLSQAERPVICAGGYGWSSRSSQTLTRLADRLGAPVFVGPMSKGAISEDHPLALGFTWDASPTGEELLTDADAVLAIGERAGMATGQRSSAQLGQQLIHVDWDGREQGPTVPARVQVAGFVPSILEELAERLEGPRRQSPWSADRLVAIRGAAEMAADRLIPWAIPFYRGLRAGLPRDALLFTDSLAGLWAARLVPAYAPNTVHFPWATGTLGHGIPAAFGAAMAQPARPIAVLAGDGAFLYNSQELAAMKYYARKLVVIVANDNSYGAILHNMTARFGRSIAHELANPDLVQLGQAYGMRALRLESPDQIASVLREGLAADGSTLIEVPLSLRPPRF